MILPSSLPRSYPHTCGGRAIQLAEDDPILIFDVDPADREDPRFDPTAYPIVWRERYACTRCHELIELTEPIRTVRSADTLSADKQRFAA